VPLAEYDKEENSDANLNGVWTSKSEISRKSVSRAIYNYWIHEELTKDGDMNRKFKGKWNTSVSLYMKEKSEKKCESLYEHVDMCSWMPTSLCRRRGLEGITQTLPDAKPPGLSQVP